MAIIGRKTRLTGVASIGIRPRTVPTNPTAINNGNSLLTRMDQIGGDLSYVFPYGIQDVSHDVGAVQFDELTRPLSLPLLQPTAATLQKVSFSFLMSIQKDGISKPIEGDIRLLQAFAAEDNSVIFVNSHEMLSSSVPSWKISSLSIQIERLNELGQAVLARGNMSCTESSDQFERFLTLPKFTYKVNKGNKTGKSGTPSQNADAASAIWTFFSKTNDEMQLEVIDRNRIIAGINALASTYGGEDKVLDALKGYNGSNYGANYLFNALGANLALNAKKTNS